MSTTPTTNSSSSSGSVQSLQDAQNQAEQTQEQIDAMTASFDATMSALTGEVQAFNKETSQ
jgi:hypothetical protein